MIGITIPTLLFSDPMIIHANECLSIILPLPFQNLKHKKPSPPLLAMREKKGYTHKQA
jgi:hypothetical protein